MDLGLVRNFDMEHSQPPIAGPCGFAEEQRTLARFNRVRLAPGLGEPPSYRTLMHQQRMAALEQEFLSRCRAEIGPLVADVPEKPVAFIRWFEALGKSGPGQGDSLFPWLAANASYDQMRWFLQQEVAGEAGFDDLVAMAQVKMPKRAKLEMARNYWDEMGRGESKGMHGPMLDQLAVYFDISPALNAIVPESLALGNMMMALALNRAYAFHVIGALGVIEMTAPGRATYVAQGLDRLGVPKKLSHYFALHAVLDVKHSLAWNAEVLGSLIEEDTRRARAIAEGAVLRLWCGAQCFKRYRQAFALATQASGAPLR